MKYIQKYKKTILTALALLAILSGCQSVQTSTSAALIHCEQPCKSDVPKIVFAETENDLGKIDPGSKKTYAFEFINDGGKDLVIENIHPSCGCT